MDGPGIESRRRARFSAPVKIGPGAHPASCTMGTGSFPGVKSGWGVTLTPHPLLVPWSRKGRAIPLLPLWTIRPTQSLSACTRVHFTFTFTEGYGSLCISNISLTYLPHMSKHPHIKWVRKKQIRISHSFTFTTISVHYSVILPLYANITDADDASSTRWHTLNVFGMSAHLGKVRQFTDCTA
jgi:hypothetical protein